MTSLRNNRNALRKASAPRQEFKQALWAELATELRTEAAPSFAFGRFAIAGVAALAVIATSGVGAYAYTSPEVTERSPLYFLKREIESVESSLHVSEAARARFERRMLRRRFAEARVLDARGDLTREDVADIAQELDISIESVMDVRENGEVRVRLREEVIERLIEKDVLDVRNKIEVPGVQEGTIDQVDRLIPHIDSL